MWKAKTLTYSVKYSRLCQAPPCHNETSSLIALLGPGKTSRIDFVHILPNLLTSDQRADVDFENSDVVSLRNISTGSNEFCTYLVILIRERERELSKYGFISRLVTETSCSLRIELPEALRHILGGVQSM